MSAEGVIVQGLTVQRVLIGALVQSVLREDCKWYGMGRYAIAALSSLAGSKPYTATLFPQNYHTGMSQGQSGSQRIPDYLNTSAIALSRGA